MESITENKQTEVKKFTVKPWMIITASIVAAFLIAGLILGFINFPALSDDVFADYLYVNVYDSTNERMLTLYNRDDGTKNEKAFKEGIDATKYSVLRSLFEFNYVNSLRFKTETVSETVNQYDDDGYVKKNDDGTVKTETVKTVQKVEVEGKNIKSRTEAVMGTYVLEFVFCDRSAIEGQARKTMTVRDNSDAAKAAKQRNITVSYDRIRIVINNSENTIEEYTMYAYDTDKIDPDTQEASEEIITPVWIRMNTTKLYEKLGEIRKEVKGSDNNGEYVRPDSSDSAGN